MPTIRTVKPLGGGDFTTLAAWQAFAATQATADQWAECYSGGDLGAVFLTAWASTPSATVYPRVYAAPGSRHDGKITGTTGTNGAYATGASTTPTFRSAIPFTDLDGLVLNKGATSGGVVSFSTGADYTLRNCIIRRNAGTATAMVNGSPALPPSTHNVMTNNIVYLDPSVTPSDGTTAVTVGDGDGSGGTGCCLGNTVLNNGRCGTILDVAYTLSNSVVWSNFLYGTRAAGVSIAADFGGTADFENNATDDGQSSANGDGAEQIVSGAITAYVVSATNPTPIPGSILIDTGKNWQVLGIASLDALGTSRPQGAAFDIGAIEYTAAAAGGGRHRRRMTELYL